MRKFYLYIAVFFLSATLWSCRELYYPDDIESNEKIPVIQGTIIDGEFPVVTIYWAIQYENSETQYISDAEVTISNNWGHVARFFESSPGIYRSYEIYGIAGNIYTLRVVLDDGREYTSTPQLLQMAPQIDSLYAIPGRHTAYQYGASGKPIYTQMEGLFINSDFSTNYPNTLYYRFNTDVVKLSSYTVGLGTPSSHSIFLWETTTMEKPYTVDFSVTMDNTQALYRHPVGYLRYYYDATLQTTSQTAPFTEAWIVKQSIYSISADVYQYYNSVGRQLSGNDQIFAPVASQVKSNIQCISDPRERVVGIFEASSLTTVYKAFGWKDLVNHRQKDLPYYPDVGTGSQENFPPDFWVYFY
ncbi:MAG TPA: DUF4249 domain-containing protein [Bacteroidales bacterium]|jgi:hypothetical protein|nr:DUF4249 domain-containing protein [Bacteroidales bacterium]